MRNPVKWGGGEGEEMKGFHATRATITMATI